ncbi:MAG: latrotoxin-related protein [Wolbachia endosymbiont of Tetragnatha montana]|nr:latrotoxin-related protein [Wolbachia endosymbiont of Tetragnatha montana]
MLKVQYPVDYLKKESTHLEVEQVDWRWRPVLKRSKRADDLSRESAGFVSATLGGTYNYWLMQADIAGIARTVYGWCGEDNNVVFEVIGSVEQLRVQLEQHKDKLRQPDRLSLTFVYNSGGNHWTTLVIAYQGDQFSAYYIDSLGNGIPNDVRSVLEEKVAGITIYPFNIRQQTDGHNCGIFALENAKIINDALRNGQQVQIEQGLSNYKTTEEYLINRRIVFAESLGERGADILGSGSVDAINEKKNTDEVPQRSELLERLIDEMKAGGTPAQQNYRPDQSFEARFRSFIHKILSTLHSVNKKGFFTHFFLGGFSTLLDTQIAKKLDIKKIYFRFDTAETLKVVVIKNGQIRSAEDITNNINLFSISEGTSGHRFTSGELEKILQENMESGELTEQGIKKEVKDTVKSKLIKISKVQGVITVSKEDKGILDSGTSKDFYEIKKEEEIWKDPEDKAKSKPEDYIAKLAGPDSQAVKESYKEIFKKIRQIHSRYEGSLTYAKKAREAAHHGFITGFFMNFRYRYHVRIGLEKLEGVGYSDIMLQVRGVDDSPDSFFTYIEVKASPAEELKNLKEGKTIENSRTSPEAALEQAIGYAGGALNSLACGVNLDYPSPIFDVVVVNSEKRVVSFFEGQLRSLNDWHMDRINEKELKERIKGHLEDVYLSFPGTQEKRNHHYLSRFLLGQLILLNKVAALQTKFEKHIFIYDENIPTKTRLKGKDRSIPQRKVAKKTDKELPKVAVVDRSHAVVTMVLIPKDTEKPIYMIHIVEANRKVVLDKKLPLNKDKLGEEIKGRGIVELTFNFNVAPKGRGAGSKFKFEKRFSMEAKKYPSLEHYNVVGDLVFQGSFREMPYSEGLQEAFGEAINPKLIDSQDQPVLVDKYDELFKKIGEGIFPCKPLIQTESHTQAVIDGLFQYYRDLRLSEVSVSTEFQIGEGKRIDMFINTGSVGMGIELKGPRRNVALGVLEKEARTQLSKYEEGDYSIAGVKKAFLRSYIFDARAKDASSLIVRVNDEAGSPLEKIVEVIYSSQDSAGSPARKKYRPSSEEQELPEAKLQAGCSSSRRKRNIGKTCVDSHDEESIEEKEGKEELIKKLFDSDEIRKRVKNIEFYDQLFKVSYQISKGETIDPSIKEALIAKFQDIDLNSIDPEIKDIVEKVKEEISRQQISEIPKNIFKEPGVAERIEKVAKDAGLDRTAFLTKNNKIQEYIDKINSNPEVMSHLNRVGRISGWAMEGMMYKNLIGDILSGNLEGVAINLGFIAGSPLLSKMAEAASVGGLKLVSEGKVFLGQTLRIASPFLARATSAFIAYDLVNQVKAFKSGDKDAIAGIAGDSIALTVDSAAIGIEIAEVAGILSGVSSITGPIGAGVTAVVFIGTDIYLAVKTVEQEDKIIHLTGWEKFKEGWRAFLHMKPEEYIEELIEEKLANNHLVENAVNFLKQHTGIQRYVFPTGKLIERKRIEVDLNSKVLLNERRWDIKWSRARPDNPRDGELLCLPKGDWESVPGGGAYLCENAIGLSYSTNRTGDYTLIDLGEGDDEVIGSQDDPNIFLIGDGNKKFTGGSKDDVFILSGNGFLSLTTKVVEGDKAIARINDNNSMYINGGRGSNTLDLARFGLGSGFGIHFSSGKHYNLFYPGLQGSSQMEHIQTILGREREQDKVRCGSDLKYVDGRGGRNNNYPDEITIDHAADSGKLKIVVRPNIEIINRSREGNFDYIAFHGKGRANIDINHQTDKLQHNFLFNYTLSELKKVEVENLPGKGNSYPIKNIKFSFQKSPLRAFDINIKNAGNNASYVLTEDKTEVKIGNEGSLYLLQNTNKPINEIVRNYPAIVNRLSATVFVKIQDEFIVIGHGKHEIISNDPLHNSHLIGNGGENVYVITPTQKEVSIYDVSKESSVDTLDLRNTVKDMKDIQFSSLNVSQDKDDLLIKLEMERSTLKFPIRLKNGVQWYQKLHVILNINMQLERSGNNWILSPLPLIFDENIKTIVITAKDIGEGNKLIVYKQAGRYTFLRLRNDLVIITDSSTGENNICTMLLSNFYREPKMETLSIEFKDITISLQEKMIEINEAVAFCPRVLQINKEFSINNSNLLSHYDCLKFNLDKMLFLKLDNRLLLLSDKGKLLMSNYYSDVDEKWSLLVELNDDIITSEEFRKRAKNASPFRYYQPGEEGLEIYHNQPDNKHQIGLIDLKNKSILDCSEEIIDGDFILSSKGEAIAKVKNWNIYQHARKVMFAFGDAMIYNKKCTVSNCNPEDIIEEFKREIAKLINKKDEDGNTLLHHAAMKGDLDKAKLFVEKGADIHEKNNFNMTSLNVADKFKQKEVAKFLDKERKNEESKQRHRRHHIRHENHHSGHRSPIQEVASSGTRLSSWINDLFGWVKDSVGRLLGSQVALPGTQSLPKESTSNSKPKVTTLKADLSQVDVNGTILLLDTFIRKFTGQKYISSNTRGITEQEALGYALSVTEKFRKVVEQAASKSGMSMHRLNINFVGMEKEIAGKIIGDKFGEIPRILKSYVEKACPSREAGCSGRLSQKKYDKFMTEFNSIIDPVINQSMQQILSRDSMLKESNVKEQEITLKPKSYLNGTSVRGHLTQDRSLRNQGKNLIP